MDTDLLMPVFRELLRREFSERYQGSVLGVAWHFILPLVQLAVLSWVNPGSPMYSLVSRLSQPFLRPFQRVVPLIGGVDLSPIALLLVLQLAGMLLAQLQMSWMV